MGHRSSLRLLLREGWGARQGLPMAPRRTRLRRVAQGSEGAVGSAHPTTPEARGSLEGYHSAERRVPASGGRGVRRGRGALDKVDRPRTSPWKALFCPPLTPPLEGRGGRGAAFSC